MAEGDMLRTQMAILRRLGKHEPANTIALGREIAARVVQAGKYTLWRLPPCGADFSLRTTSVLPA